jgi:membrane fusion protein (multidrug efflux system)
MNKFGTFMGLLILLAGAVVVFYLFRGNRGKISEKQQKDVATAVSVHVAKVSRSVLHGYILAYGRIEPSMGTSEKPAARVLITAPVDGIISEAMCVEGQEVHKGDTLFSLDSRMAKVAVKEAQQAVQFAEKNFERQKELLTVQGTSEKLMQQAEHELKIANEELTRANTQLSLLQVTAPISGMIVRVLARPGEAISMTTTLAELIDLKQLIVECRIPSAEVSVLKPGQKVEIETGIGEVGLSKDSLRATGELTFIDSMVDPESDTVLVRASISAEAGLRPGQFVKMRIVYMEKSNCMVVPEESLVTTTEGQTVIAIVENGKAFQKIVQPGLRENGLVEVQGEGIHDGLQVVTDGAYGLLPETMVRIITE